MKLVYANQELPESWSKSIFLAGPTPRSSEVQSWRGEAVAELGLLGYDGAVFIPEDEHGKWQHSYVDQVEWEERCLNASDCVVFWIPRDLATMPGFTTNIELGVWLDSGKAVIGFPEDAPKTKYIKYYTEKLKVPNSRSLKGTLEEAVRFLGEGAERTGGARKIPLFIYNTKHFQDWYVNQIHRGNRLDDAKVLWNFRVGKQRKFPLFWSIHVDVYVAAEDRNKSNEIIISRSDISSVLAYKWDPSFKRIQICLVREFRSPSSTGDGFIWELPGGSSPKADQDPFQVAAEELAEETGLKIPKERFKKHEYMSRRQLTGTLSTHGAYLFSVALEDKELNYLKQQKGKIHGNYITDSEQTYVEVVMLDQILNPYFAMNRVPAKPGERVVPYCDWATLGMIFSVLGQRD
jgi:8-oxo-dGTP pyrophosphatase MutT (NUDIX family)/nucleoside 2-deoxyribosyltransferase